MKIGADHIRADARIAINRDGGIGSLGISAFRRGGGPASGDGKPTREDNGDPPATHDAWLPDQTAMISTDRRGGIVTDCVEM
jgi:hypothetical protein